MGEFFGIIAVVVVGLIVWIVWGNAVNAYSRPGIPQTSAPPSEYPEPSDVAVTKLADNLMEGWFHTKVVGVSFRNDDGTSRQALISHCRSFDSLTLELEPDNPVDKNAVKVLNEEGRQLGYVSSEVARQISGDTGRWNAFVRNVHRSPDGKLLGLVIIIGPYSQAFLAQFAPPATIGAQDLDTGI